MTLTSSARRTEQPLQVGSRHGYRIEGDQAVINAELSVPAYHPGGAWALELWASERPYQGGELSGLKVSEVALELPTPLAPHTHRVEATVPARLPLQGRAYFMYLALVERGRERRLRDVASYPALESFPAPQLLGEVGYELCGHEVRLHTAGIANPRGAGNLSGTLSLELWAWPLEVPAAMDAEQGLCLGAAQLQPVAGGEQLSGLQCRAPFREPPAGSYALSLLLREWTHAYGYVTRDRRDFALPYRVAPAGEAPADVVAPSVSVAPPSEAAAEPPPAAAAEEPAVAVEAAAAEPPASMAVPKGTRGVSINLASIEELARVKGLNRKLAKAIVEQRPFASIDALIDVRGIGKKTLDKLRSLVTL